MMVFPEHPPLLGPSPSCMPAPPLGLPPSPASAFVHAGTAPPVRWVHGQLAAVLVVSVAAAPWSAQSWIEWLGSQKVASVPSLAPPTRFIAVPFTASEVGCTSAPVEQTKVPASVTIAPASLTSWLSRWTTAASSVDDAEIGAVVIAENRDGGARAARRIGQGQAGGGRDVGSGAAALRAVGRGVAG